MNNLTSTLISRSWNKPFSFKKLNREEPCQAVLYENRRLELIAEFQPQKPVKLRKRS